MNSVNRIAMLSVHTCPLAVLGGKKTGGMNVYVRELSRELGRRGIKVDVYTRSQNPCIPHVNDTLGENARVIHIPCGPEIPLDPDEIYPHLPEFVRNVKTFASTEDIHYDLIYSHYWLSGLVAHELRADWAVPVAQMFHTLGMMKDRIVNEATERPVTLRAFNEADIMSWVDRIIAATPAERAQMLWLYRANRRTIEVVPPGVDTNRFRPIPSVAAKRELGLPVDQRMLLFVGRIEPLKAVDTIFQAMAILKQDAPHLLDNLCISIIGGDPDTNDEPEMVRLKELRDSLGLGDLVMFLGAKDQDTLNYYYAASEALIMPSDYESFGMVALEAMASGTPVIASETGGLAFLVRDNVTGFLVPVRDPQMLSEKIRLILEKPEERNRLGHDAHLIAQEYAWTHIADRLLAVFATIIPGHELTTSASPSA
ncbi:MAG TPA: glycosyltransferase [Aggregatilineales bacterium]|nr:glycosyltransferase [Aggregatilineales bacterium]